MGLIKDSLNENKEAILNSLPTDELKEQFLNSIDHAEDSSGVSTEEVVAEAIAPDHVSENLYDAVKKEIETYSPTGRMSEDEEKAAIEEALKNPPAAE